MSVTLTADFDFAAAVTAGNLVQIADRDNDTIFNGGTVANATTFESNVSIQGDTEIGDGSDDTLTIQGNIAIPNTTTPAVNNQFLTRDAQGFVGLATPDGTNLASEAAADSVVVSSSTGDNATIAGATTTLAGVLSATDKQKIDNIGGSGTVSHLEGDYPFPIMVLDPPASQTFTLNYHLSQDVTLVNVTWAGELLLASPSLGITAGDHTSTITVEDIDISVIVANAPNSRPVLVYVLNGVTHRETIPLSQIDNNTTYDLGTASSGTNGQITLTGSDSTTDNVTIVGGQGVDVSSDANGNVTIASHAMGGSDARISFAGAGGVTVMDNVTIPGETWSGDIEATVDATDNTRATFTSGNDTAIPTSFFVGQGVSVLDTVTGGAVAINGEIIGIDIAGGNLDILFGSAFVIPSSDARWTITSSDRVTTGNNGFSLNQQNNEEFSLSIDPNNPNLNEIQGILDNRAAIEAIRNGGHLNHIHSSTPFTRVPYPNPSATDERRWETPAAGTQFQDLSWVNASIVTSDGFASADTKVSRACFWLSSLPDNVNVGGANWYRHINLIAAGNPQGQATGGFSIPANSNQIVNAGVTQGLYERLELLATWEQNRLNLIARGAASRSWTAGAIHTQFGAASAYNGWQVGLTNDDLGRLTILSNDLSPFGGGDTRLAYTEAVIVFANDATDGAGRAIGRTTAIPVRRVARWSPSEFAGNVQGMFATQTPEQAGRLLSTNADRWEIISNNFGEQINFPGNQDFQVFFINPAASISFNSNGIDYNLATQFGRRQTSNGTWTGLPLTQFGDPNALPATLESGIDADARPTVSQLRLYTNGSTVTRDTLTEIKTGWDAAPVFDATDQNAQHSLLATAYTHLDSTENFNEIIQKNSDSQIVWDANNPNVEQLGRSGQTLAYLGIDVSQGDHEIAADAAFTITEIYDEALEGQGQNLGQSLRDLGYNRDTNKFPLPIDNSWIREILMSNLAVVYDRVENMNTDHVAVTNQPVYTFPANADSGSITVDIIDGSTQAVRRLTLTTDYTVDETNNRITLSDDIANNFPDSPADTVRINYTVTTAGFVDTILNRGTDGTDATFTGLASNASIADTVDVSLASGATAQLLVSADGVGAGQTINVDAGVSVIPATNAFNIGTDSVGGSLRVRGLSDSSATSNRLIAVDNDGNFVIGTSSGSYNLGEHDIQELRNVQVNTSGTGDNQLAADDILKWDPDARGNWNGSMG